MARSENKGRVHVVSRGEGWAIKKEGNSKATKIYTTKEKALAATKKYNKNGHDVVVHRQDGSIQSYKRSNRR